MTSWIWTEEKILLATKLWTDMYMSPEQIAKELGVSKSSLDKFAHRNRDILPKRGFTKKKKELKLVAPKFEQYKKYADIAEIHKCRKLWFEGLPVFEILEKADISYTTFNKMRKYAPNQFPKRSNKSENIISASFVPKPGKGYFLKSAGGYLHCSTKTLTLQAKLAWRGNLEQAKNVMDSSSFKLIPIREY